MRIRYGLELIPGLWNEVYLASACKAKQSRSGMLKVVCDKDVDW